jgi:hypothetical protein
MPASPETQRTVAKRRAQVVSMRLSGATYGQIAQALGLSSAEAASKDFCRAMAAGGRARDRERPLAPALAADRLDRAEAAVNAVLQNAMTGGDHAMVLKAVGRLVQIATSRQALAAAAASAIPQPPPRAFPESPLEKARLAARRKLRAVP